MFSFPRLRVTLLIKSRRGRQTRARAASARQHDEFAAPTDNTLLRCKEQLKENIIKYHY